MIVRAALQIRAATVRERYKNRKKGTTAKHFSRRKKCDLKCENTITTG